MDHVALAATWPIASRKETLSLSRPPGEACVGMFSTLGVHNFEELAWPTAALAPHAGSRTEPEIGRSWEQAKLPGWPLSSCLQTPKDGTLRWSRNSGHWLLFWSCWGSLVAQRRWPLRQVVPHSPRLHLNKISPFSLATVSRTWLLWQEADEPSFFCLVTWGWCQKGPRDWTIPELIQLHFLPLFFDKHLLSAYCIFGNQPHSHSPHQDVNSSLDSSLPTVLQLMWAAGAVMSSHLP